MQPLSCFNQINPVHIWWPVIEDNCSLLLLPCLNDTILHVFFSWYLFKMISCYPQLDACDFFFFYSFEKFVESYIMWHRNKTPRVTMAPKIHSMTSLSKGVMAAAMNNFSCSVYCVCLIRCELPCSWFHGPIWWGVATFVFVNCLTFEEHPK